LGDDCERGVTVCDEAKTHVPLIPAKNRAEHLSMEHMLVHLIGKNKGDAVLSAMKVQFERRRYAHRQVLVDTVGSVLSIGDVVEVIPEVLLFGVFHRLEASSTASKVQMALFGIR